MRLVHALWFFILWLKLNQSAQQNALRCKVPLQQPEGTQYNPANKKIFSPGDTLSVRCEYIYWILNHQTTSAEVTCKDNGEWTTEPACREVRCNKPQDPSLKIWHAISYSGQPTTLGDTAWYRCKPGYKESGHRLASCTRNGWSPYPLCIEVLCDKLDIEDAIIFYNNKMRYRQSEEVMYTCTKTWEVLTLTCDSGVWTGNKNCSEIFQTGNNSTAETLEHLQKEAWSLLNRLVDPVWTFIRWLHDSVVHYLIPPCGTPPALQDGDVMNSMKSNYSHNETVEYVCQKYHTMEGEPYRTCIYGEWTGHQRCLKPCIVNEDDMRRQNVILKSTDTKYFIHDALMEFRCVTGTPVGAVALNQRCNSGVFVLPTCQRFK